VSDATVDNIIINNLFLINPVSMPQFQFLCKRTHRCL